MAFCTLWEGHLLHWRESLHVARECTTYNDREDVPTGVAVQRRMTRGSSARPMRRFLWGEGYRGDLVVALATLGLQEDTAEPGLSARRERTPPPMYIRTVAVAQRSHKMGE